MFEVQSSKGCLENSSISKYPVRWHLIALVAGRKRYLIKLKFTRIYTRDVYTVSAVDSPDQRIYVRMGRK